MNTITDAELNRRLAEKLGYHWYWPDCQPESAGYWDNGDDTLPDGFSPATDRNHLAEYVLPEVERRGLEESLGCELADLMVKDRPPLSWPKQYLYILTLPPRVLALAALKALEEKK